MQTSEIIRRVKEIQLRTRRQVADVLAGEYVSVFRGGGIEFDEVRPYVPGDDIRSIDWNVTARTGEPHVKRYVEERQLTLMLVADVSASQDFGSQSRSKRETAAEFCALLAFSAIRNDDKVGLVLFHSGIEQYIPPRKGQKHALRVVREVLAHGNVTGSDTTETVRHNWVQRTSQRLGHKLFRQKTQTPSIRSPRQGTDINQAMDFLLSVNKRRSVCFVVSDFQDENFEHALSTTRQKHDVIAVLISDPHEMRVPPVGLVTLTDAETGATRLIDTSASSFCDTFADSARERVQQLEKRLRRRGIDLIQLDTTASVVDPLVQFFRMREKRMK